MWLRISCGFFFFFSGFPGDGMQQPAYTQHQNMDQFQPRMMALQPDAVHHQVWAFFLQLSFSN